MIPKGWSQSTVGEVFSFQRTVALSRAQLSVGAPCGYIHYGDIHTRWNTHLDLGLHELPSCDLELVASAARVVDGDLVLADASEDLDGVGKAVEIRNVGERAVVAGLHTVLMRPRPHTFAPGFAGYLTSMPEFVAQARTMAAGLKVFGLSKTALAKFTVFLPPLAEQQAIAEALSDADTLVESLNALIAKKHDMKRAAMQQLLTGRTRLRGESTEWAVVKVGEFARMLKGRGLSRDVVLEAGTNPCLLYGELFTTYKRVARGVGARTNSLDGELSVRGDVLMPGSTTTSGEDLATATALLVDGVRLGGDVNIIRPDLQRIDPRWLAYVITHCHRQDVALRAQGVTIHHLYGRDIASIEVRLPDRDEQTRLADVLEAMDAEIDALVAQREKAELVKQGMMQELLSGRVRLA